MESVDLCSGGVQTIRVFNLLVVQPRISRWCPSHWDHPSFSSFRWGFPSPTCTVDSFFFVHSIAFSNEMSSADDKTPQLIAVASAFLALVVFSVAVRIFTRLRLVKWLGADDWLMVCAMVGSIMLSAGTIACTSSSKNDWSFLISTACKYGMGKHLDQQAIEHRKPYMIADLIASLSYSISAMFVKLSLLTFYVRLTPEPHFRMMTYTLMAMCAVFGIASAITVPLQCIPISMLWDTTVQGHCIDINNFYFANAGIHMFTEILIFALPIQTLWHLHLPLRQKLGLCGLMSIGAG